jgi:hypothetical protein
MTEDMHQLEEICRIVRPALEVGLVFVTMRVWADPALDPLFFLHHANLDRIWASWQALYPSKRLYEISGRSTVNPPYRNVTLAYQLKTFNLAPPVTIAQVMDTTNPLLNYVYV